MEIYMSLKKKLLLFFLTQLFFFALTLSLYITEILLPSYENLEKQHASKSISRLKSMLNNEVEHFALLSKDWAYWDDLYHQVDHLSSDFIKSNLDETALDSINLHTVLIFDKSGVPVYKSANASDNIALRLNLTNEEGKLIYHKKHSGLVSASNKLYIVTIKDILNTAQDKPSKGTLVFIRFLNKDYLEKLKKQSHLDFSLHSLQSQESYLLSIKQKLKHQNIIYQKTKDEKLSIFTLLSGLSDTPELIIQSNIERVSYLEGLKTISLTLYVFIFLILIIFISSFIFLQQHILKPLRTIATHIKHTEYTQEAKTINPNSFASEFLTFTTEYNTLLQKLKLKDIQLQELSRHDTLTGLHNKRALDEFISKEIRIANREKLTLCMLMIDIDYFKKFNDIYGRQAGDEALKSVAEVLTKTVLRPTDMIARYGGKEFAIILPNTRLDGAEHLAKEILKSVNFLNIKHEESPTRFLSVSIGVTYHKAFHISDYSELFKRSDQALHDAKNSGRNQYKMVRCI